MDINLTVGDPEVCIATGDDGSNSDTPIPISILITMNSATQDNTTPLEVPAEVPAALRRFFGFQSSLRQK